MRFALAIVLALLPIAAVAKQPALHDIAWYKAHDQARLTTLRMCHGNASLQNASDDCENAERAEATAVFRGKNRNPLSYLNTTAYWAQNPLARLGELNACNHPEDPGNATSLPYCAVARQAQSEEAGSK